MSLAVVTRLVRNSCQLCTDSATRMEAATSGTCSRHLRRAAITPAQMPNPRYSGAQHHPAPPAEISPQNGTCGWRAHAKLWPLSSSSLGTHRALVPRLLPAAGPAEPQRAGPAASAGGAGRSTGHDLLVSGLLQSPGSSWCCHLTCRKRHVLLVL